MAREGMLHRDGPPAGSQEARRIHPPRNETPSDPDPTSDTDLHLLPEDLTNDKDDVTGGRGNPIDISELESSGKILTGRQRRKLVRNNIITPMQEAFIAYYVATRDKEQSALQAGYSPACAKSQGKMLLNPVLYPLVSNKIKELMRKQQDNAVMDGVAILAYIHSILNFQPAMWFMPGGDGGWVIDMDDVRVLPAEVLRLIESMEVRTTTMPDGTSTNKMWVKFISKTQALAMAARYQLGDLNKETTQVVQIDWGKLFGRNPLQQGESLQITETTTQRTITVGTQDNIDSNDPVEAKILQLEAKTATASDPPAKIVKTKEQLKADLINRLKAKK